MFDALENFGRDDDWKCDLCGGKTYLTFEQPGLNSYECEKCGDHFQVEFDLEDEREDDEYCDYDYADFV